MRSDGSFNVARIGLKHSPMGDLYHFLLTASWLQFLSLMIGLYLTSNLVFALLYGFDPGGISELKPANLWGRFFFSIQTMSTVGYGSMAPTSIFSHCLMTLQSVYGFLLTAVTTGLVFAKFSQVRARVLYSQNILIHLMEGEPVLTFRAANERSFQILDARVKLTMGRQEMTSDGEEMRRIYDLELKRETSPMFALLWNVYHEINTDSPLYGYTPEQLENDQVSLMISLNGVDDALGQQTHSRHAYRAMDILFNQRFVDIIGTNAEGKRVVNYHNFHKHIETGKKLDWDKS